VTKPGSWNTLRLQRLAMAREDDEPCCRCGGQIHYELSGNHPFGPTIDHLDPLVMGHSEIVPLDRLAPSHQRCNASHGGKQIAALVAEGKRSLGVTSTRRAVHQKSGDEAVEPPGRHAALPPAFSTGAQPTPTLKKDSSSEATRGSESSTEAGPGKQSPDDRNATERDPVAPSNGPYSTDVGLPEPFHGPAQDDAALAQAAAALMPWLQPVVDQMGPDAVWPRVMSGRHPLATGTHGYDAIDWIEKRRAADERIPAKQKKLRWFQKLFVVRVLEHDEDGALVWETVLLSTSRQVGKSVLLRELALWRGHASELFGEPQFILHTAKDLNVADEVQRPGRVWAEEAGYKVRYSAGTQEIQFPDEGRWAIRTTRSVYGYSAGVGAVDEAWGISSEVVDDGIEPVLAEREQPQLWLISTAHREATELFPGRRRKVVARLNIVDEDDALLVEWSSDPTRPAHDIEGWREASPHWTKRRQRVVAAKLGRTGFDQQWRNIWPDHAGDKSWINPSQWADLQRDGITLRGDIAVTLVPDTDQQWWQLVGAMPDTSNTVAAVHLGSYSSHTAALAVVDDLINLPGSRVTLLIPRVVRGRITKPQGATDLVIFGMSDLAAATTTVLSAVKSGWLKIDGPADWGDAARTAVARREASTYRISDKLSPNTTAPAIALAVSVWWASRKDRPVAWVV
jgi:hypothetical protein